MPILSVSFILPIASAIAPPGLLATTNGLPRPLDPLHGRLTVVPDGLAVVAHVIPRDTVCGCGASLFEVILRVVLVRTPAPVSTPLDHRSRLIGEPLDGDSAADRPTVSVLCKY